MATAAPALSTAAAEETTSGGKKKILIALVLVVVLAAGAWFTLLRPSGPTAPQPGAVVTLDPVYVNLAGGGYLKVGLALQLTTAAGKEAPDGAKALDLAISEFSQASTAQVTGSREAMKKALEKKVIDAYDHEVMGIYYTEYVTQ